MRNSTEGSNIFTHYFLHTFHTWTEIKPFCRLYHLLTTGRKPINWKEKNADADTELTFKGVENEFVVIFWHEREYFSGSKLVRYRPDKVVTFFIQQVSALKKGSYKIALFYTHRGALKR